MPKKISPAARARKRALRYLTPVADCAGATLGYRFNPGPSLRRSGVASKILQRADGAWMSLEEAQLYRDRALRGGAPAAPAAPAPRRTLNALWAQFSASAAFQGLHPDPDENLAADTARFYRSMIKPWLDIAGDELVGALDKQTIKRSYSAMKGAGSHHAAHASLRALQAALAHAVEIGWLAANPATRLQLARPAGRLRLAGAAEISALVECADASGDGNLAAVADAIVAALWTGQRQADLLDCDLGRQMSEGMLIFARTHEGDYSQRKTRGRGASSGGQVQIKILPPLAERLAGRSVGLLLPFRPKPNHPKAKLRGAPVRRWSADTFRHHFEALRAAAALNVASVADLEFRDLRDTAVTRLHMADLSLADIALWTGHSMKSIHQILQKHYLVSTRVRSEIVADRLEEWRLKAGLRW